jgi:hypothetical protein
MPWEDVTQPEKVTEVTVVSLGMELCPVLAMAEELQLLLQVSSVIILSQLLFGILINIWASETGVGRE